MLETLKELIAEQLSVDAEDINLYTSFRDDLDVDSLDLFELIMAVEDKFNIDFPSSDAEKLDTVEDIINYLQDHGIDG
ncbi:MAG: acyl carrier protein [Lachnospiraceae bacterium]|nr:acyl carrier protein [Lachnospiraceae bacterium]